MVLAKISHDFHKLKPFNLKAKNICIKINMSNQSQKVNIELIKMDSI